MKSEYYKQVQIDTHPRKSDNKGQPHKKSNDSALHNAKTHSRHYPSQKQNLKRSTEIMKRSRQQSDYHKLKMSYSKPTVPLHTQKEKLNAEWFELKCVECELLKQEQGKSIKQLRMVYEEELTSQKQRFIQMEKKYLLKQNELITFFKRFNQLQSNYLYIQNQNIQYKNQAQNMRNKLSSLQNTLDKTTQQNKNYIDKIETLHRFLKLYLEQTKIIINWARAFEEIHEDLPNLIHLIKEDILVRKFDCEVTFKEAAAFELINFSEIKQSRHQHSSFVDQDSGCETFMKYLNKQQSGLKGRSNTVHTSAKKGHSFIDSLSNKENIDTNGVSIRTLLNSRVNESKCKGKTQPMGDEYLRLLLLQAKTIEASKEWKADSVINSRKSTISDDLGEQPLQI